VRIALIVQRYGAEVVGGSETLARQYAQSLQALGEVEVLTTCALDHSTWANHYTPGVTLLDGIPVRRFAVDFERGPYWVELYRLLLGPLDAVAFSRLPQAKQAHKRRLAAWPKALQEETVRWQGPYSSALLDYLAHKRRAYDAFIFFSYLFPTSYLGMRCVPRGRIVFCPTLHDEPIAYLPIFRESFERARSILFLTEAERSLARRLYGFTRASDVIGMALTPPSVVDAAPRNTPPRYVLYAGRIEAPKGTETLLEYFLAYKARFPSDLKLVLIGACSGPPPRHPDVQYRGLVSEAEKFTLMRHAQAFVHPSPYESFAIVLLESLLMGTPVLVNRRNEVLLEHLRNTDAGLSFDTAEEFAAALHRLMAHDDERRRMGERGRRYVRAKFLPKVVTDKLRQAVLSVVTKARGRRPNNKAAVL
jgi:glycosyltransferase involved in cell wall biosynthesis